MVYVNVCLSPACHSSLIYLYDCRDLSYPSDIYLYYPSDIYLYYPSDIYLSYPSDIYLSYPSDIYLYYPVLGQQSGSLRWRVLVHCSDVLTRPGLLTVQVEAIPTSPSLDHTQPGPQLCRLGKGTHTHTQTHTDTHRHTHRHRLVNIHRT